MAHITLIEDERGELVDINYFCSDWCAQSDPHYAGWYGCVEVGDVDNDVWCVTCDTYILYPLHC